MKWPWGSWGSTEAPPKWWCSGQTRRLSRRAVLLAFAAVTAAGPAAAQLPVIRGAVTFEGGGVIPKGRLEVYLEDPAGLQRRAEGLQIESDGGSKAIAFPCPSPRSRQVRRAGGSSPGWSGPLTTGWSRAAAPTSSRAPADVTLSAVMY